MTDSSQGHEHFSELQGCLISWPFLSSCSLLLWKPHYHPDHGHIDKSLYSKISWCSTSLQMPHKIGSSGDNLCCSHPSECNTIPFRMVHGLCEANTSSLTDVKAAVKGRIFASSKPGLACTCQSSLSLTQQSS